MEVDLGAVEVPRFIILTRVVGHLVAAEEDTRAEVPFREVHREEHRIAFQVRLLYLKTRQTIITDIFSYSSINASHIRTYTKNRRNIDSDVAQKVHTEVYTSVFAYDDP
jgi:hypothetical protein